MIYLAIYGMLAFGTLCVAIAPATRTLWKIGLLFFLNWVLASLVISLATYPSTVILTAVLDMMSTLICFALYFRYKCAVSHLVMWVFLAQAGTGLWFVGSGDQYTTMLALNILFILNALVIIGGSLHRLLSKNRREHDIPTQELRRRSDYKFQST